MHHQLICRNSLHKLRDFHIYLQLITTFIGIISTNKSVFTNLGINKRKRQFSRNEFKK